MARHDPWREMPRNPSRREVLGTLGESTNWRNPVRIPQFGNDYRNAVRNGGGFHDWAFTSNTRIHQRSPDGGFQQAARSKQYEKIFGTQTEWTKKGPLK
jgi:hypothetical protein